MSRVKILRTIKRVGGVTLFVAGVLGALIAYVAYRHEYCMDLREVSLFAYEHQDWQVASDKFRLYMEKCDKNDQQILSIYTAALFNRGKFTEASSLIDYTKKLFPDDPIPQYWSGVLLVIDKPRQDLPRAISILTAVRDDVHYSHPQVDLYLGLANLKSGNLDQGCRYLGLYLESPNRETDYAIRRKTELTFQRRCAGIS